MNRTPFILSAGIGAGAADASNPLTLSRIAELADAALIDLLLLGELSATTASATRSAQGSFDPLLLAGWLSARTHGVAVVPIVGALDSEPFHVARAMSAVDFLTKGRSGWLPTTLGTSAKLPKHDLVPKAQDFIAATQSLWRSWDADALIIDQASGVYLDPAKVRRSNYVGPFHQVLGPLNAARPPQGFPILVMDEADPLSQAVTPEVLVVGQARLSAHAAQRCLLRVTPDNLTADILDAIDQSFRHGFIDGLHLTMTAPTADLESMTKNLLPALRQRELLTEQDRQQTLRTRLALPVPA